MPKLLGGPNDDEALMKEQKKPDLIECRLAQSRDVPFIYESLKAIAIEQGVLSRFIMTHKRLEEALFSDKAFAECIVAELDQHAAGLLLFAVTHQSFTVFNTPGIYVHETYVAKEYRRKGVAKRLGEHLIVLAEERGYSHIDGIVLQTSENAVAFFKNMEDLKELDYIHYMRMNLDHHAPPNQK
jgi:GNAT superfamily N-acetyltransferase